jgi:hypothetical protein
LGELPQYNALGFSVGGHPSKYTWKLKGVVYVNSWLAKLVRNILLCACWTLSIRGNTIEHLGTLLGHLAISTYVLQNKRLAFVHISQIGHNFLQSVLKTHVIKLLLKLFYSFQKILYFEHSARIKIEFPKPMRDHLHYGLVCCGHAKCTTVHPLFQAVHL